MKKTVSIFLAGSACLFARISHANEGFYSGINLGQSTLAHQLQRDSGTKESPSITTRSEDTDFNVNLMVGYRFALSEAWYLNVEGFYSFENASTQNKNNLLVTEIDLNSSYGATLKPGFQVTPDFSVYGIFGVIALDFDVDNSYPFAPPMRSASEREAGFLYGVGAEATVGNGWSVVLEYAVAKGVSFDPIPEVAVPGKVNPNELDYANLSVGVRYRF